STIESSPRLPDHRHQITLPVLARNKHLLTMPHTNAPRWSAERESSHSASHPPPSYGRRVWGSRSEGRGASGVVGHQCQPSKVGSWLCSQRLLRTRGSGGIDAT